MSISQNIGMLGQVNETLGEAIQFVEATAEKGTEAITGLSGVAGDTIPEALQRAMEMVSEGQHNLQQVVASYAGAIDQINDYVAAISG